MALIDDELAQRIKTLRTDLESALQEQERKIQVGWARGKVRFEKSVLAEHRKLKSSLLRYVLGSSVLTILTAPIIYMGIIPFLLVDLFLIVYQGICFPVYGIPKVRRADHFVFDRGQLRYLNLVERINCVYCSYGNGLLAYAREISARTEQHWCPIKHAHRMQARHSRYEHFLAYGDAGEYREKIDAVRNDFVDLRTLTRPDAPAGKGTPPTRML